MVTSRQYGQYPARKFADSIGATAIIGRYIPGTLTNPLLSRYIEPDVVVVTDPVSDLQVIKEALQVSIPVVALCDTNNMTSMVEIVLPTNNKGRKALSMIYFLLTKEFLRHKGYATSLTVEDFETDM